MNSNLKSSNFFKQMLVFVYYIYTQTQLVAQKTQEKLLKTNERSVNSEFVITLNYNKIYLHSTLLNANVCPLKLKFHSNFDLLFLQNQTDNQMHTTPKKRHKHGN